MRISFLLSLFLFCCYTSVFAQTNPNQFTTDQTKFPAEVRAFLELTRNDECIEIGKVFEKNWVAFSSIQKNSIIEIANTMRERKMLTIPYFKEYFQALVAFQNSKLSPGTFDEWYDVVTQVIANLQKGNNKPFDLFMTFSINLFTDNSFTKSVARTWQSTNSDYNIGYKNNAPYVTFSDLSLKAYTTGDTMYIHETSGTYFPYEQKWIGKKGIVNWKRAGLDATDVTTRFNRYTVDCERSEYSVDTAFILYQPFVKKELMGRFQDKLLANNKPSASSYPRFNSYNKNLVIENLADNARLVGGFQMQGAKVSATGDKENRAELTLKRFDGQIGVKALANEFSIKAFDQINSIQAEVSIYEGKDSIYHNGASFRYRFSTKQLVVLRGEQGISKSAFFDSYHQYEIYADGIYWNLSEPTIYIKQIFGAGNTSATWESYNYFEKRNFDKYQNIADYNIINSIKKYTDDHATKEFYSDEFAKSINPKYNSETVRRVLYKLVEDGFIYYDESKELITVRQKALNYVLYNRKFMDYDIIKITSQTDSINAKIDLLSYNMDVKGVKDVLLSDSNFVVVLPAKDSIRIKKNRDMDFNGKMFAGRVDLYGKGFGLNYADWRVSLPNVDTLLINLPNGQYDKFGSPVLVPIHSYIEHLTGTLTIDGKVNKSGRKRNWAMPSLKSDQNSFVYYERESIFKSIYKKDKFYFELDPFEFDSLNAFKPSKVSFSGKLVSAGIFPDITDRIGIQQDLSLGFLIRRTGISLYGGKGSYTNQISLDNRGLRGKGSINYLPSVTKSEDIIFYPDSLYARAQSFEMKVTTYQGVDFPSVTGVNDYIHWKPYSDSMIVTMDSIPFKLFDSETQMVGSVVLTPKGLQGSGTVDWADATLKSSSINFGKNKMNSDTSEFTIKSIDPKKFALRTTDVNAKIDFDKMVGEFKSNTEESATELPYNLYRTSMNEFKWDMAKKFLTFKAPVGTEGNFVSTHPEQDSLTFTGTSAKYSLTDFILKVNEVPYIRVADASIIPDSGKVVVEPDAKMQTLLKAKLIADTTNEFHNFYNVTANVYGKTNFKASGDYDFFFKNGIKQKINFGEIGTYKEDKKNWNTYAKSVIDSQKFFLIPKVYFRGEVNIKSAVEPLNFNGYARLQLSNPNIKSEWFTINNEFTRDSSLIYYKDPENTAKRDVTTGIVFANDSSDLYTSFFNAKKSSKDRNIFIANGIVFYDEQTKEFIAGDADKILNEARRGNILKYNDASGKVYAEGKMEMGLNFGLVDIQSAGYVKTDVQKNKYDFKLLMGLQFNIKDDLLEMLGKSVLASNFSQEDVDYFSDDFTKTIPEFIDKKDDKKFDEKMNKEGTFKRPVDSKFTIFFTDLHLVWNRESKSFYSKGPIGIAYIGNVAVNRVLQGAMLEIGYKKGGDYMNLYIPGDEGKYFFFYYQNNNMQILSGDRNFNVALDAIDPEKRRTKTDDGKVYQYNKGSENKKNSFISKMQYYETGKTEISPNKK